MTKDKIKLNDLAEDLKIPRQELLGTAREMNLAVRSVQGSVTPEEADKLRRHYEKIRQADKDQKQRLATKIVNANREKLMRKLNEYAAGKGIDVHICDCAATFR